MNRGSIRISPDQKTLFEDTATLIADSSAESIAARGRFTLVLTGGNTPRALYELLASESWKDRIDWSAVQFFWGDERFVHANDPQSNFGMAKRALLDHLKIKASQVHRIVTENTTPEICASNYALEVAKVVGAAPGAVPVFDFILNGMGTNCHTASLFPNRPTLHEYEKLVVADYIPEVSMNRITMTYPLLNAARRSVFLVAGKDKAAPLREVIFGDYDPENKPSQAIQPTNGELIWMLDRDAAAQLPQQVL